MTLYAIIRIRGQVDVHPKVRATLKMLRLNRKYHAVIYPKNDSIEGMLRVVKDWVTWGEIDAETLRELIARRGRLVGGKPISDNDVKRVFNLDSIDDLVKSLIEGRVLWHKYDHEVVPVFRLHPPSGGFKGSIKKPYRAGGELGYRGIAINELLRRMI